MRATQESCQPKDGEDPNPRKIFKWVFGCLPFKGSTPLLVQDEATEQWSEILWNLGFRQHPELQTHKYRMPWRGQQHPLNGAVSLVDINHPDPEPPTIPNVAEYTPHEQAVIAEQLYQAKMIGDRVPKHRKGEFAEESSNEPPFNPADHSPSTVNGYLMAAQPAERRRVVAAEMIGKQRDQILRKWPGV